MLKESHKHKIHVLDCQKRPAYPNYLELGYLCNIEEAEQKARSYYSEISFCDCCIKPEDTIDNAEFIEESYALKPV
jgi:hypothetical protein